MKEKEWGRCNVILCESAIISPNPTQSPHQLHNRWMSRMILISSHRHACTHYTHIATHLCTQWGWLVYTIYIRCWRRDVTVHSDVCVGVTDVTSSQNNWILLEVLSFHLWAAASFHFWFCQCHVLTGPWCGVVDNKGMSHRCVCLHIQPG